MELARTDVSSSKFQGFEKLVADLTQEHEAVVGKNFIMAAASLAIDSDDAVVHAVKIMILNYFTKSSIGLM